MTLPHGESFKFFDIKPVSALRILLSFKLVSALWSSISDCDEVYNYWEPAHMLLFKYGFQTWEYSPIYALRSYAYLWIYTLPLYLYKIFQPNKVLLFYTCRCLIGCLGAYSEYQIYKALKFISNELSTVYIWLTIFPAASFISSTAFLPSTFALHSINFSFVFWSCAHCQKSTKMYIISILFLASAALIGWPFAAILGLPMVIDLMVQRKFGAIFKSIFLVLLIILLPMCYIDSLYFGKFVLAPLNLVLYNVFGSNKGPELYGVEPWWFYHLNLFLNFNVVYVFALMSLPILVLHRFLQRKTLAKQPKLNKDSDSSHILNLRLKMLFISPMYLWFLVFFNQPHKEERFMFPIYSFIIMSAAISLIEIKALLYRLFSVKGYSLYVIIVATLFGLYIPLNVARITSLVKNYHGSINVFTHLYTENEKLFISNIGEDDNMAASMIRPHDRLVCMGKDWYRFPSHFFLPNGWKLRFIKSEFDGQLPGHFGEHLWANNYSTFENFYEYKSAEHFYNPSIFNLTRHIPQHMNDLNQEEISRYVPLETCDLLIDMFDESSVTPLQPNYSLNDSAWVVESKYPFLDSKRSNRILRAFYIPYLTPKYVHYNSYNLLVSKSKLHRLTGKSRPKRI